MRFANRDPMTPTPNPTERVTRKFRTLNDSDGCPRKTRVMVVVVDGHEGFVVRWTANCSGCTNYVDGQLSDGPHGCSECGYTGKRRREEWVPFDPEAWWKMIKTKLEAGA